MSEKIVYSGKDLPPEGDDSGPLARLAGHVEAIFEESALAGTTAKVDAAFGDSSLAVVAEDVEAIFPKSELPVAFIPGQPPALEQSSEETSHLPGTERIVAAQVEAALVEAGVANAFQQGEDPPHTSKVTTLLYLNGEGQLGRNVDEGARRAGLDGTSRDPAGKRSSQESSRPGGTPLYDRGLGMLARQTEAGTQRAGLQRIQIAEQRGPLSARVSGAFGPTRRGPRRY